jgi:flavin-dependent thymidylate synthase
MSKLPVKWADKAMYEAAPVEAGIKVYLLSANPDPLGSIAAACKMYEGKPTYNLFDITDRERWHYWKQVQRTHLKAPLEFVNFHFLIEGVTRAFTHQMVRQRTAVYAQESLRFAVKENMASEAALPPSIPEGSRQHRVWLETLGNVEYAYNELVNSGVPAEDARGLLPHATTTRLHYGTNLRGLLDHAGNRLCTQAQFEWRKVFIEIMNAIRHYEDSWQWKELGSFRPSTFAPICYQKGHCPFQASFDRQCTIRERVERFASQGVPSERWADEHQTVMTGISDDGNAVLMSTPIYPEEWLADPTAGRRD